jgi:superfamily II DNA or RNA helicase
LTILDPAQTELVADTSSRFDSALLYLESQRRRVVPNDQSIHMGHMAVMDLVPYQLEPALQALKQPRTRILIADSVGLGKTLEAGILATELIRRGRGRRILVVTQKSMLTQFQKEWWSRFSIPLVRLDSVGLQRVRNLIPSNHNPFNYFDRSIISMDTLKTNLEYRNYLSRAWWDIIVIDECHNVAARAKEQGLSRRARLAQLLATRSDSLILLSATPHDGSARSFASLISLLDATAISNPDEYTRDDFRDKGLVIRRFKKDIKDQLGEEMQERQVVSLRRSASPQEEAAFVALLAVPFTQAGQHKAGKQQELQRVAMQKAMFSSPRAALHSTQNRMRILSARGDSGGDEAAELAALGVLDEKLRQIEPRHFSKYQRLLEWLKSPEFGWNRRSPQDRLVVFSERLDTLRWLKDQLSQDLGLRDQEVEILDGQMGDMDQQELVERFGSEDDPIRLLLCSDVASEGLNLHYFCHRLIHFDLPWSLMVFQQRNGRVDRYGQKHKPSIVYLLTDTVVEKIKGDLRILEILKNKDDQAYKNLGDPATFLKVHDPDLEAEKVSDLMASGRSPEEVEKILDSNAASHTCDDGDAMMDFFMPLEAVQPPASVLDHVRQTASLFVGDYDFARTALANLSRPEPIAQWTHDDASQTISITPPRDLEGRLRQLPREIQRDYYVLTADKPRMLRAIEEARQTRTRRSDDPEEQVSNDANTWPQLHYLWPQHPILEWLADRVLTRLGRHRAPVIQSDRLSADEQAYVLMSLIPNRKAQPVLVEWRVACRRNGGPFILEPFEDFAARAGLKAHALTNPGSPDLASLQSGVPGAVHALRRFMVDRYIEFSGEMNSRLRETLDALEKLRNRRMEVLQLTLGKSEMLENLRLGRLKESTEQISNAFDQYRQWIEETMTTEPEPYIQVLAAVSR